MTQVSWQAKYLFSLLVCTMITLCVIALFTMLPGVAKADQCPSLGIGDLVSPSGASAVYLLGPGNKMYYFANPDIFSTWYKDFSSVKKVPANCLDTKGIGGPVPFRAGSRLVKRLNSPYVYAVLPGGQLERIENEDSAKKFYGQNWGQLVRDIADEAWTGYTVTERKLTDFHEGQVVRFQGKVYVVKDGSLHPVTGQLSLNIEKDVRDVNEADLEKLKVEEEVSEDAVVGTPVEQPAQADPYPQCNTNYVCVNNPGYGQQTYGKADDIPAGVSFLSCGECTYNSVTPAPAQADPYPQCNTNYVCVNNPGYGQQTYGKTDDIPAGVSFLSCGECTYQPIPQCSVDSDCGDSNSCTTDSCVSGQCQHTQLNACGSTEYSCTDGIDNDRNGLTDCSDSACASNSACTSQTADPYAACTDYVCVNNPPYGNQSYQKTDDIPAGTEFLYCGFCNY